MEKNKNKVLIWSFVASFLLLIVVGVSYAFWNMTFIQNDQNNVGTQCFKTSFEEKNDGISLLSSYPMNDIEGKQLKPYTFTITNVCGDISSYQVNLEKIAIEGNEVPSEYIKVELNENTPVILTKHKSVEPVIENAKESYKLISGTLKENESATYDLRMWLDEDTPAIDETIESSFLSKVSVVTTATTEDNVQNEVQGSVSSNTEEYNTSLEEVRVEVSSEHGLLNAYYISDTPKTDEELKLISNWELIIPESSTFEIVEQFNKSGMYYIYFRDENSNYFVKEVEITKVDLDGPSITATSSETWGLQNEIVIRIIDNQSGFVGYAFTNTEVEPNEFTTIDSTQEEQIFHESVTQNGTYYIWAKDTLGNISHKNIEVTRIDDIKPRSSFSLGTNTLASNGWYQSIQVNVTAIDDEMGVRSAKYCTTTSTSCEPNIDATLTNNTYTVTLSNNANGQKVCSQVIDNASNVSEVQCSEVYKVDNAGGSSSFAINSQTAGSNGWYQALSLKVNLSDEHSGVSSAKYCVTTSSTCTPSTAASISNNSYVVTFGSNASAQRVCSQITDTAGNESSVSCSDAYKVDTVNPTAKISATVSGNSITVSSSGSSDDHSKVASYQYSKDGTNYSSSTSTTFNFTNLTEGNYTLYVKAVDNSGRVSSAVNTSVYVALDNVYVSSSGNDSTGFGSSSKPFATLTKAYSQVKSGGNIVLLSNITQSATSYFNTASKSVNLKSNGSSVFSVTKASNLTAETLVVDSSNTLNTSNVTFDGNNVSCSKPVITIGGSSTYNLNSGTTIQRGNNNNEYSGGGIVVSGNAKLNINGGTITNNKAVNQGGGVYVNQATVTLNSGTISNNSVSGSSSLGGGIFAWYGTVNIKGGTISSNTSANSGGGIWVRYTNLAINSGTITGNKAPNGGGVYYAGESGYSMSVTGGTVSSNTASDRGAGMFISNTTANITGVNISSNVATNYGGGIHSFSSTLNMSSGTIYNNTASSKSGGGISAWGSGSITINGSAKIQSNHANSDSGGGIYVSQSSDNKATSLLIWGGTITGNTANYGAGVYGYKTNVSMSGGTISSNTAAQAGGGAYLNVVQFNMSGGSITGNKATNNSGGGVALVGSGCNGNLSGGSITSNTAASGFAGGLGAWSSATWGIMAPGTTISGNSPKNT